MIRKIVHCAHSKTKPRFGECHTRFECETKMGAVRILVIFQDRSMFSHIIRKVSARAFHWCGWTNIALSWKIREQWKFWLFFKIGLCSAISLKRSERELSIDVTEHSSILKNKGAMRVLVIFKDRSMFCHIIQKVSARAFHWCGWTQVYLEKWPKYVLLPF